MHHLPRMVRVGKTPAFRSPRGELLPGSIAETMYLPLGGLDQWVMIRGKDLANPPLILLHGGPGFPETQFFRYFNAPLEQHFTVVHWEQRGAGKSYRDDIPPASMTVEQFISDLDELVDAVCRRLAKNKVVLFGHSWGSALGVLYAKRFPQKVLAYASSGQVGDPAVGELKSYAFALSEAERIHHVKAVEALKEIGPPPHTSQQMWTERTWLARLDRQMTLSSLWALLKMSLASSESSVLELPKIWRAFRASIDAMWSEVSKLNLLELAPRLEVPVFFLLGRNDHVVPAEASVQYFDALVAPSKQLLWFEHSGHEPFADEPESFNAAMIDVVRPAALAREAPSWRS
jgi:pimeloyl-ACP methyl ester carboxylesterase